MESFLVMIYTYIPIIFILGFLTMLLVGYIKRYLEIRCENKQILVENSQNVKIGDTWVTLTNKEPEPKYTDYELELMNEIDNAFKSYIENKGILNNIDVAMLNQFVKLNPKTKMKFSYENEKMYNVKFLL